MAYDRNGYAIYNIKQSLRNARTYCSFFDDRDLGRDMTELIEEFIDKADEVMDNWDNKREIKRPNKYGEDRR